MYFARIIKTDEIVPHPNADKLNILKYNGLQFVVGKDVQPGDLVAVFFTDGQLSNEFCKENNLYRDATLNKNSEISGYFENTRRVRAQKFRGEMSYGIVFPVSSFYYTGFKDFKQGMEFSELNGHEICRKYVTNATRALSEKNSKTSGNKKVEYNLMKHFDTENINYHIDEIPENSLCFISIKMHGTSGRTGHVKVTRNTQNIFQKFISRIFGVSIHGKTESYEYVSGTRNTIVNNREDIINPDSEEHYRWQIHKQFEGTLKKGETVYYEIVGYNSHGSPIMSPQNTSSLKDKSFQEEFGKTMVYDYGCGIGNNPMQEIYVYRITQECSNGEIRDLSWFEIERRCKDLGLKTVKVILTEMIVSPKNYVPWYLEKLLINSASEFGNFIEEGYVFRFESKEGIHVYKAKNPYFLILEGVLKESDIYVDIEEVS